MADERQRRLLTAVALLLGLAVVGGVAVAFLVAQLVPSSAALGGGAPPFPSVTRTPASAPSPQSASADSPPPPATPPSNYPITDVRAYDPLGDGTERPDLVDNAVDGDLSTAWSTELYNSADLGGLKSGVGLLLDLGQARALHTLDVIGGPVGATIEFRVGDDPAAGPDSFAVLATGTFPGGRLTLDANSPVTARYVLVWFTQLGPAQDAAGYEGQVAAVSVR